MSMLALSRRTRRSLLAVVGVVLAGLVAIAALAALDAGPFKGETEPASTTPPSDDEQAASPSGDDKNERDEQHEADREDGDQAGQASEDADGSATSEEPGDASQAAACQAPPLDPAPAGAVVLHEECTELSPGPGDDHRVDGHAILADPPACAAFGLHFSWKVTSTPPTSVDFTVTRQGSTQQVASGITGDGAGLCGVVKVTNPATTPATLDLRYRLLDCEPTGAAC